jgi:GT2 family glycosyltransferase
MQDASRHMIRHQNLTSIVPAARLYPLRESPLVTVLTPTYNRAAFLEETIESVLTQDYQQVEYLVLDDGSTDNSAKILEKYQGRDGMQVLFHENIGETLTVNKGFSLAAGDIVVVVNSDDPLLPGAISEAVRFMKCHPEVLAAYPDWIEIGPDGSEIARMRLPYYDIDTMLMKWNVAMGPGTFIRREAFDRIGLRDAGLKYTGDLDFWFRLARIAPLGHIGEFLATHRSHPGTATLSGRGHRMAAEIVRLASEAYASDDLPVRLIQRRRRAFCLAHYAAARQCGREFHVCIRHWMLAIGFGFGHLFSRAAQKLVRYQDGLNERANP